MKETNTIALVGEINEEFVGKINDIENGSTVILSTQGGDIYCAKTARDLIAAKDLTIVISGLCASAGIYLIDTPKVKIKDDARIMVHKSQISPSWSNDHALFMAGNLAANINKEVLNLAKSLLFITDFEMTVFNRGEDVYILGATINKRIKKNKG